MKKILLPLFLLGACSQAGSPSAIDPSSYAWEDITKESSGTAVTMYMWGGDERLNAYLNQEIARQLKSENNITFSTVPVNDIQDTINKLIVEKQAGRKKGSADILWLNGENFKLIKEAGALWGAFAQGMPSMAYINPKAMESDFGTPVENLEAPWGEAQFNFIYNGLGRVPFTDAQGLGRYVRSNPRRFTYPAIPDFLGSAFVRNIALDIIGYDKAVALSDEEFAQALMPVWEYFNNIKPYLWKEGATYPENTGKLDLLFQEDNIDVTMSYTITRVTAGMKSGIYPKQSKSFLLNKGTLFNNNYLTIPWNSPNPAGALYVINHLLSKEVQIARMQPESLAWPTVLNFSNLSAEEQMLLDRGGEGMVPAQEAASKRILELSPEKLEIIEKGWLTHVAGFTE